MHRISAEAETDLDAAWYYTAIESGSAQVADRLVETITSRFLLLQLHHRCISRTATMC